MNNVNGILLLIGSMATFAFEDTFIKYLSSNISTGQIMIVLGLHCGIAFTIMSVAIRKRIFDPVAWQPLLWFRADADAHGFFETTGLST